MEMTVEEKLLELEGLINNTHAGSLNPGWWFNFKKEAHTILASTTIKKEKE